MSKPGVSESVVEDASPSRLGPPGYAVEYGRVVSVVFITQSEADGPTTMEKVRVDDGVFTLPVRGCLVVPLQSPDKREQFLLDVSRGRIDLLKRRHQSRGQLSLESRPLSATGLLKGKHMPASPAVHYP